MARTPKASEATPNADEAATIKGMRARGDKQQWIVAWFGGRFNPGRINECVTGKRHPNVKAVAPDKLPPPGPYVGEIGVQRALIALEPMAAALQRALQALTAMKVMTEERERRNGERRRRDPDRPDLRP